MLVSSTQFLWLFARHVKSLEIFLHYFVFTYKNEQKKAIAECNFRHHICTCCEWIYENVWKYVLECINEKLISDHSLVRMYSGHLRTWSPIAKMGTSQTDAR